MTVTKGYKTKIGYGDQVSAASLNGFTPSTFFAGVTAITPPKTTTERTDTSNMEPEDGYKEKTAGWKSVDDVEITIQYNADQEEAINALVGLDKSFKVVYSDGSGWAFNGFIADIGDGVDKDGIVTTVITMAVSGKPVPTKA